MKSMRLIQPVAADVAREMARGMLSKFQPCLPQDAEDRLLAERLLDVPGTLRFLGTVRVGGERIGASGAARRVEIPMEPGWKPLSPAPGTVAAYHPQTPAVFIDDAEA